MARTGLSFDDLDHVGHAAEFDLPILIFVDHDDATVPVDRARAFAAKRPDITTLVETKGGGHTGSWNVDPDVYEGRHGVSPITTVNEVWVTAKPSRE